MKISGLSTIQALSRPTNARENVRNSETPKVRDSFQASEAARNFNTARKAAAEAPDVREARIADIQARIQAGSYNVSAFDVASKLVDAVV